MSADRPESVEEWPAFNLVEHDVWAVNIIWNTFCGVFQCDKVQVEDLNRKTGEFFYTVQRCMLMDLVRRLMALLDPSQSGKNRNASLMALAEEADRHLAESGRAELKLELERCSKAIARVRHFRNKDVVHFDLSYRESVQGSSGVYFEDISTIIDHVNQVVGIISRDLWDWSWNFDDAAFRVSNSIVDAVRDSIWLDELAELLRRKELTPDEVAQFISDGRQGLRWQEFEFHRSGGDRN